MVAGIPYGFRMVGSSYDDEPFRLKQLEKMVKDFANLITTSLWRIVVFHLMAKGACTHMYLPPSLYYLTPLWGMNET